MLKYIKYSLLLVSLLGLNYCTPAKKLETPEKPIIKTIKSISYAALEDKVAKKGKAFSFYAYDSNGHLIKTEQYKRNGSLKNRDLYEYDNFGNQIKSSFYATSTRINSYSKSEYVYDDNGKVMIKHHESGNQYSPKKHVSKTTYSYKNANLAKEVREEIWLGKEETITTLHQYNTINSVDSTSVYRDLHLYKKITFQYNDEGILLESTETTYPKGGNPKYIKVLKKYDAAKNITLRIAEDANGYYYKKVFEFNSLGLKTKLQEFKKDGKLAIDFSYEYTFDKNQNWISSKTYSFGKIDWITEREITYHE